MATDGRCRSARGPGVLLVAATGLAAAAVALDAGFDLPAPLRAILFAAWAAAVGVLGWGSLGRGGSRRGEAWLAGGAAVVAFGAVVLLVPGGARAGRLAPPWAAPPVARLTVTTGDPVVARGQGVTVASVREPGPAEALMPLRLDVRGPDGEIRSLEPVEEPAGVFSARLPAVGEPLAYRFAAGASATAWHDITPVDPVVLAPATVLTAEPPGYAAGQYPTRRFVLTEPVVCLAGGRVTAALAFDRPAVEVRAVWQPDADDPSRPVGVEVAADRRSATLTADAPAAGRLLVTTVGDHGYQSVHAIAVAADLDRPPGFVAISGFESGRYAVRADEVLSLSVEVADDVWSAPPTLHLLVGPSADAAVARPVPLTALGGGRFAGRLSLPLSDQWQDGRTVARLRLADALRPAGVLVPADGWTEFTRAEAAAPLAEQIVLAQRDRVASLLAAAGEVLDSGRPDAAADSQRLLRALLDSLQHVDALDPLAHELRTLTASTTRPDAARVAALGALNRHLASVRLDRLRLGELVVALHASNPDAGRLRDRLAAVVASSPRLSAARAAADERAVAFAVQTANHLADELDEAADRLIADRASRLRPLADRVAGLTDRLGGARSGWAVAGRLVGADRDAVAPLRRGHALLQDARSADALPVLDTAGRQLDDLATAFAAAADARGDPREAARQLVRWRADLDARPGPPPADELTHWHAAARTLAGIARPLMPAGGETPEQIARAFPPPMELKRRSVRELRDTLARTNGALPSSDVLDLVARLDALPPPAEGRGSRLASAAARRASADGTAGRVHDLAAGLAEFRWRLDLLAQRLDGNDPAAVLDEPADARSAERLARLAVRVGLPPDLGEADALRRAVRARLDGTDTDRGRVTLLLRWWAARPAVGPEHVRELLDLADTLRVGDDPSRLQSLYQLLRLPRRPADFKAQVTGALERLRDGTGKPADVPLAEGADLDRPTNLQRLIALDAGGHLPGHPAAGTVRRFAAEVQGLARDLADLSARLQADSQATTTRAVFSPAVARLEVAFRRPGVPEAVKRKWGAAAKTWNGGGELVLSLRATATALRQLGGVAPAVGSADVSVGRYLIEVDELLGDIVTGQVGDPRVGLRTAATALEAAAR